MGAVYAEAAQRHKLPVGGFPVTAQAGRRPGVDAACSSCVSWSGETPLLHGKTGAQVRWSNANKEVPAHAEYVAIRAGSVRAVWFGD